jgi:hypothetical protein
VLPAGDEVKTGFMWSYSGMLMWTTANRKDIQLLRFVEKSTLLPASRQSLVEAAINADCTHVLWLDSDMIFPKDVLARLLAHKEPIVAANYVKRRLPIEPVSATRDTPESDMRPVYTDEASTGLQEVYFAGMGCMLVDMDVYKALPRPWFNLWYAQDQFAGEDVFFCYHARHNGIKVLVDHDVSKEVSHIGEIEFRHEHAEISRKEQE